MRAYATALFLIIGNLWHLSHAQSLASVHSFNLQRQQVAAGCDLQAQSCLAGVGLLGQGFDILAEKNTGDYFLNFTLVGGSTVSFGAYGTYNIPAEASATLLNRRIVASDNIGSADKLSAFIGASYNLSPSASLGVGILNADTKLQFDGTSEYNYTYLWRSVELFEVTVGTFDSSGNGLFAAAFNISVHALPPLFDNSTQEIYFRFLSTWGTHWIWRLVYGLKVLIKVTQSKCNTKAVSETKLAGSWGNANATAESEVRDLLLSGEFTAEGGDHATYCKSQEDCDWDSYSSSLTKDNFVIVSTQLQQISDLPLPPPLPDNLKLAIKRFTEAAAASATAQPAIRCKDQKSTRLPKGAGIALIVLVTLFGIGVLALIAILIYSKFKKSNG